MDNNTVKTIGVLVPTYQRRKEVIRCLEGLTKQTHMPDDVIVVYRKEDKETYKALLDFPKSLLKMRYVAINEPGIVAARNLGCKLCFTDVLCMIDDDAVPHSDWLERILLHFQNDPKLGGLGGRDWLCDGDHCDQSKADIVGKMQWFGRVIGNFHLGHGPAREVDLLKGANMSYRSKVFAQISFNTTLRGKGAQPCEDKNFAMAVRHAGWKLIYDPAVAINHYVGQRTEVRHYDGVMPVKDVKGFRDFAYNEIVSVWNFLSPTRKLAFLAYSILVGTNVCPGMIQAIRFTPKLGLMSWKRFFIAQQGIFLAVKDTVHTQRKAVL